VISVPSPLAQNLDPTLHYLQNLPTGPGAYEILKRIEDESERPLYEIRPNTIESKGAACVGQEDGDTYIGVKDADGECKFP